MSRNNASLPTLLLPKRRKRKGNEDLVVRETSDETSPVIPAKSNKPSRTSRWKLRGVIVFLLMLLWLRILMLVELTDIATFATTLQLEAVPDIGKVQSNTSSFCILTKDDNQIMNEWIAYHYHVLNLRHMVVAVDPDSQTSPEPLLNKWRDLFGMTIDIWHDEDYMPDFFLEGHYDLVESYVGNWQFAGEIGGEEEFRHELTKINNHRFRQHTFVSYCLKYLQEELQDPNKEHWVAHVDTDEYITINPVARQNPELTKPVGVPQVPVSGSIFDYLHQIFLYRPVERLRRTCLLMPRILFSPKSLSFEDPKKAIDTEVWNIKRFESLRWRIHRALPEESGYQKAMMDVAALPSNHSIFYEKKVVSVHRPLLRGPNDCTNLTTSPDVFDVDMYPLTVNHYIGSLERYMGRNDTRRHASIWKKKRDMVGDGDDTWILSWLQSFVDKHGLEKVSQVLGDYHTKQYKSK